MLKLFFSSGDNYVATLTLGGAGAHATYYHKANDQVSNIDVLLCFGNRLSPKIAQMQHFGTYSGFCILA